MTSAANPACARVCARIERLLDRELAAVDEARDQGHLEACAACRSEHARAALVFARLREPAPALDFALAGLDQRLSSARGRRPALRALSRRFLSQVGVQTALAVAAGLLALLLLRRLELAPERPVLGGARSLGAAWSQGLDAGFGWLERRSEGR